MADVYGSSISPDDDAPSPTKCREARRRRIEARRASSLPYLLPPNPLRRSSEEAPSARPSRNAAAANAESNSRLFPLPSSSSSSSGSGSALSDHGPQQEAPISFFASSPLNDPSLYGWISISGRSREMEDAITAIPRFVSRMDPFDFFGVFDGHGGSHISQLCRDRMHVCLAEELMAEIDPQGYVKTVSEEGWRRALRRSFRRVDDVAMVSCACGRVAASPPCQCERSGMTSEIVGSTAVVAVVGQEKVIVANCGDSRAVLSRAGRAIALSHDHKPDRADELARIEAAGGRVIVLNGEARVLGILAMSRAIGDRYLKPLVISDPDIMILERSPEDEFIILASDGLWDVLTNDLACNLARQCLNDEDATIDEADEATGNLDARCTLAASILTRLAMARRSVDNISVIVVDLKKVLMVTGK